MKTTGMVRRIDELGRIVIPKEIRKQLMMKEGESIAFSLENEKIVLTKFSVLNKMSPTIQTLLEGLYAKYRNTFLLCDKEQVIICSSDGLSQYQRKQIPDDLHLFIEQQQKQIEVTMSFIDGEYQVTLLPLVVEQESQGAFIMLTKQTPYYQIDETLLKFIKSIIEQEMMACV